MKQYSVTLTGLTPLIMHQDNLAFGEKISQWRNDPANKEFSVSGDDRSPAWSWLGYLYHDTRTVGIPSDNLMTMLRQGGAKVRTGKKSETYKNQTQAGILIDTQQWDILNSKGETIPVKPFYDECVGNNDFAAHVEMVERYGFELLVKRAKVNTPKHVRVRPFFRDWTASGTLTVIDEKQSGLTERVLDSILNQAGALVGLGDWRPSSPKASGTFGKFSVEVRG